MLDPRKRYGVFNMDNQHVLISIPFEFDVSAVLLFISSALLCYNFFKNLSGALFTFLTRICICTVEIDERVDQFDLFKLWASRKFEDSRHQKLGPARPIYLSNWQDDRDKRLTLIRQVTSQESGRFELSKGRQYFFAKGRLLYFECAEESGERPLLSRRKAEVFVVGGLVWSIGALKDFIQDVVDTEEKRYPSVKVYQMRTPKERPFNIWELLTQKPPRPLETVALEQKVKDVTIKDLEIFFNPRTAHSYTGEGTPYRRAWLFHGLPGNGKSSWAYALAGHFNSGIYILNFADKTLDDATLSKACHGLPPYSIILVEDIDTARVARARNYQMGKVPQSNKEHLSEELDPSDGVQGVTLGGLLNVMDGLNAPTHVLWILSTNQREVLDDALTRPGRIDLEVEFENAKRSQMEEMFLTHFHSMGYVYAAEAKQFARELPENMVSAAQIKQFLRNGMRTPQQAVEDAKIWGLQTSESVDNTVQSPREGTS
jgi:chaperone BCS1